MRHMLSTALVALVVGGLAGASMGAWAQSTDGPPTAGATISPAVVSRINADRVDGRHAVGAAAGKAKRAGKLVATNSEGYLPKNIVEGLVTEIRMTTVQSASGDSSNAGEFTSNSATCPEGSVVTGGGFTLNGVPLVNFIMSRALDSRTWSVIAWNTTGGGAATIWAYANCMSTQPAGSVIATKVSEYGPAKMDVTRPR